jgi:hypothetical protein
VLRSIGGCLWVKTTYRDRKLSVYILCVFVRPSSDKFIAIGEHGVAGKSTSLAVKTLLLASQTCF